MLFRSLLIVFTLCYITLTAVSQPCLPNGITLTNQQDIDQFAANFPNCSEIEGFLKIEETTEGNITNLNGLIQISHIGGDLQIIQNKALENLVGLNFLQSVGGSVWITQNSTLNNLHGLNNLNNIGGFLQISFNDAIYNLNGIENLNTVGSYFAVQFNETLNNVNGVNNLSTVGNFFTIQQNPALKTVAEFESLLSIGSFFNIQFNDDLESISGFPLLQTVNGFMAVQQNPQLFSINAFETMENIGEFLNIQFNNLLDNIYGFSQLLQMGGTLNIQQNASLEWVEAFDLLQQIGANLLFRNNPDLSEVFAFQNLNYINGNLIIDNCDQLPSLASNDVPLDSINGNIELTNNDILWSLWELRSIAPGTIQSLTITGNPGLEECDVKSICNYLDLPSNVVTIENNGTGCNTLQEVQDKCGLHPDCSYLTSPADGQTNVLVNSLIEWMTIPEADGYLLSIGLESDNYNLLNLYDMESDTSYENPFNFPCFSEIFVKITPYNSEGMAFNCIEESFTTEVLADAGTNVSICERTGTQLNATGGMFVQWSPFEGLDNPFISNPLATPVVTTTYFATINNGNGCSAIDSVTITVLSAPKPNTISTDETGNGYNDGTATCFPDEGLPPFTFEWSTGDTTSMIDSLPPGDYYVTVTDSNLCRGRDTVTINPFICPDFLPFFNHHNISCFGECDGFIYISNVLNAIPPLSYLWNNGDTSNLQMDLCPGTYSVTITDSKNCSLIIPFSLEEPAVLTSDIISTDESGNQFGDGTAMALIYGGTPPYQFQWSNGSQNQIIGGLDPAAYTLTVTDANDCIIEDSVIIKKYICPELTILSDDVDVSCFGECDGSILPEVFGGTEPYTYNWSNGGPFEDQQNLCAGNYSLTITDIKNCSAYSEFNIEEPEEILVSVVEIIHVKVGQPGSIDISLENEMEYNFQWSGPNDFYTETLDIDSLEIGCYSLLVTHIETECTLDTTVCVEDLTGTELIFNPAERVEIYPNPGQEQLNIRNLSGNSDKMNIFIWDINGKLLFQKEGLQKEVKLEISDIQEGIYLIGIQMKEFFSLRKWIVGP